MKLLALGVDHRSAPTHIRERLAFDGAKLSQALEQLVAAFPGVEFVVLSTCNRVEVYAAGESRVCPEVGLLTEFLAKFHGLDVNQFHTFLVDYHDEGAIEHLFRVTSSLESLVLGEGQILGQVKDAYKCAMDHHATGRILNVVFQQALRVGKKVREETGMDRGRLSIASVAVDLAHAVFDTFADKTVLVIGTGEMGELTLRHLKALNPRRVLVTNRNEERAKSAALEWGGQAVPFDRLHQALIESDLVISTTAAPEPIVTFDAYVRVQRARRNRLALVLDIAVPRDFDPRIGSLEQVLLYNIDDLSVQAEENRKGREEGVTMAQGIVAKETNTCLMNLRHQWYAGALLRQLGDQADSIRSRELEKLYAKLPHLSDDDREVIALFAHRLQNQYLHNPRTALRSAVETPSNEQPHSLLNAVRHLFGLADR